MSEVKQNVVNQVQSGAPVQEGEVQQETQKIINSLIKAEDVVGVVQETIKYTNDFLKDFVEEYVNKKTAKWQVKGFINDFVDFLQEKLNSLNVIQIESDRPIEEMIQKENKS